MKKLFKALQIIFGQSLYRNIAVSVSLITAYISYWLFYQTTTIPMYLDNIKNGDFGQYSSLYGYTYIATTILIIILSGISVSVVVWLYRHSKIGSGKSLQGNLGGLIAALFAMGCPICGAFLLSAIGIAGGLSIFPLKGLELKFLSLGLLGFSTIYGLSKVRASDCEACQDITIQSLAATKSRQRRLFVLPLQKVLISTLIGLFFINQLLMGQVSAMMGIHTSFMIANLFGAKGSSSYTIIAPKLNPDGKTTSLVEQPTITEVPGNPQSGDSMADARMVMIPTGKPFYAPGNISFDDPINAQKAWGAYEDSITLTGSLLDRYNQLINSFTCNYCCGGPTNVTVIALCGCQHAKAWRGMFKYMLQTYGDKYTNEQLKGEAYRWTGIWYPKGVLEDYLLATGKTAVLPHETHGGAGTDGMHGLK